MLQRTFAFGGTLLVAAALTFLTPGPAAAQLRGGFRGPIASPRPPVMRFAPPVARPPAGAHYGAYRPGFVGGYPYHPYHGGGYHGWRHPYPYYGYGVGAYYSSDVGYAADPPYSYTPYDHNPYSGYYANDSAYPSSSLTGPSDASPFPGQPESPAHVTVTVPAKARVWFDGTPTATTGRVRQYVTPPLTLGRRYTYWARARWNANGRGVNQLQPVEVTAGGHFTVTFPAPPSTGG